MVNTHPIDIKQSTTAEYKDGCGVPIERMLECEFIFRIKYDEEWTRREIAEFDDEIMRWLNENVSYAFTQTFFYITWIGIKTNTDATHFKLMFT